MHNLFLLIFLTMWFLNPLAVCAESSSSQCEVLEVGKLIEKTLRAGEVQRFSFRVQAGDYLRLTVEQRSIDVVLRLKDSSGRRVIEIDDPSEIQGTESLTYVFDITAEYILEIVAQDKEARAGTYTLRLLELRVASEKDREIVRSNRLDENALNLRRNGKYDEALELAKQGLALREQLYGTEHSEYAQSLNTLALIYRAKSENKKAEPLLLTVLAIREKVFGAESMEVASALNNLAGLYRVKGELHRAETLYTRSMTIREKLLNSDSLSISTSLNNIALLYRTKGDYAKAESYYIRALKIREQVLGSDHQAIGNSINNLAGLYRDKGEYQKAEELFLRSLSIREKGLHPLHPSIANSLNNLANLYRDTHKFDKAEPLYKRALAIREKALGEDHPHVSNSLNNLAVLYRERGEYQKAEELLLKSIAIREKALGGEHATLAYPLTSLGELYFDKGESEVALQYFSRALTIRERILGTEHPEVAGLLYLLADVYRSIGEIDKAVNSSVRGNEVREHDFQRNLVSGSEREKLAYLKKTAVELDKTISLHIQSAPTNRLAAEVAMTVILRRKGRALDAMANSVAALHSRSDKEDQQLLDELSDARNSLSRTLLEGEPEERGEDHAAAIKDLEERVEILERRIGLKYAEYNLMIMKPSITVNAVGQALPPNSTLIEYVTYRPFDPKTRKLGQARYAAYALTSQGEIKYKDIGEVTEIDRRVEAFRSVLRDSGSDIEREVKQRGRRLDALVMEPMRKVLGSKRLFISPDGALNLIPFDALVDERGRYLVESFEITYLTSGRDLLRLQKKIKSKAVPVLVADPDFAVGEGPRIGKWVVEPLKRLKGTAEEAVRIRKHFRSARLIVRRRATEEAVRRVAGPEFLHLATHGFFLGSEEALTNPLIRSGLFFAGANRASSEGDDGIMTALEVASLNLWGTRLVVLSACDTGVGDVRLGEGVYGLRRALVLAGSETQLMSLWPVDDVATRDMMTGYYRLLSKGVSRSKAFRAVQLSFLRGYRQVRAGSERNLTRRGRKTGAINHPYYWAAFIQSGEWGRLSGRKY